MSQTSFTQAPVNGYAGQVCSEEAEIVSYIAASDIKAGSLVVLNSSGKAEVSATGAAFVKVLGVAALMSAKVAAADSSLTATSTYSAGDTVPIVRKGRIFARFSGGTQAAYAAANCWNASTDGSGNLVKNGAFSASATSASAGLEITATAALFVKNTAQTDVCLVELNLP